MTIVLITGGTGLLGRAVATRLQDLGIDVETASRSGGGERHHSLDLTDAGDVERLLAAVEPDAVVQLVGGPRPRLDDLFALNVLPSVNVLHAVRALGSPARVVLAGSAAEYGDPSDEAVVESAPLVPVSDYGRAKVAQTVLGTALANAGNVPLTILRPFNVVAPSLPATTPLGNIRRQLVARDGRRRTLTCGRLDVVRDFVPLDFVARVTAAAALEPRFEGTWNVCSGVGIELGAVVAVAARRLGVELEIVHTPELIAVAAPERVVGDPAKLAARGFRCEIDAEAVASTLLDEA